MKRFEACGWAVKAIDGHKADEIDAALAWAKTVDQPVLIACLTTIGYGAPTKGGSEKVHGSPLGADEIKKVREFLGWPYGPFEIPESILSEWRGFVSRSKEVHADWKNRNKNTKLSAELPTNLWETIHKFCQQIELSKPKIATRKSSELVLEQLTEILPNLLGGSADLTGSNNTKTAAMQPINPQDHRGNYIYYGIREHAMAAVMNGLALHGEFIPYGGTFLVFTDYCRPAIRLSALMEQRVIYVMTHDSIGLGEDRPTHQPVEHLASLRCIPNLHVFRPADTIETAECWFLALTASKNPSLLALSRQNLPTIRQAFQENLCAKGGYVLQDHAEAEFTLIATGSEVSLALDVAAELNKRNILARVVSMPCRELFSQQSHAYQQTVLGQGKRVFIEAASKESWYKYARSTDLIFGMATFGMSAPAEDVFDHFGFTVEKISSTIIESLKEVSDEKN